MLVFNDVLWCVVSVSPWASLDFNTWKKMEEDVRSVGKLERLMFDPFWAILTSMSPIYPNQMTWPGLRSLETLTVCLQLAYDSFNGMCRQAMDNEPSVHTLCYTAINDLKRIILDLIASVNAESIRIRMHLHSILTRSERYRILWKIIWNLLNSVDICWLLLIFSSLLKRQCSVGVTIQIHTGYNRYPNMTRDEARWWRNVFRNVSRMDKWTMLNNQLDVGCFFSRWF